MFWKKKVRPLPTLTAEEIPVVVKGLRAIADDVEAGRPLAMAMVAEGVLFPEMLDGYLEDPNRFATAAERR